MRNFYVLCITSLLFTIVETLGVPTCTRCLIGQYSIQRVLQTKAYNTRNAYTSDLAIKRTDACTQTRRSNLLHTLTSLIALATPFSPKKTANGSVGTLPEFSETNAILQGITVDVTSYDQLQDMISFLKQGFNFQVLRKRSLGTVTDTWMGFGPEQTSVPSDFILPISSFSQYGGHSSIHIRYDSTATTTLYAYSSNSTSSTIESNTTPVPGNNIAFLQVGVPNYRISQLIRYGGNVLDAYGFVNVISPSGLPIRGIIGIWPDPIMFLAIYCVDVNQSRAFYEGELGFVQVPYPYARPSNGTGQFEPPQPEGSIYLSPSRASMGLLLLPYEKDKKDNFFSAGLLLGRKKADTKIEIKANPVVRSVKIVYNPTRDNASVDSTSRLQVTDPSRVPLEFVPLKRFEEEERSTRVLSIDS